MSVKKIFVYTFPALSHLNAIVNVINELVQTYHFKVVIYGMKEFEQLLLKTGSEFRAYENFEFDISGIDGKKRLIQIISPLLHNFLSLTNENLFKMAVEIDTEKPDLILYDSMALPIKWVIRYLEKNNRRFIRNPNATLLTTLAPPNAVVFNTGFANEKGIFPDKNDEKIMFEASPFTKFFSFFSLLKLLIRTKMLSMKFGIEFLIPMEELFLNNKNYKQIVFTIPEIQPKAALMHSNIVFIGSCFNDNLRTSEQRLTKETPLDLRKALEAFKPLNPTNSYENLLNEDNNRLFFVSLGTLFNSATEIYLKIIEAVNLFNNQTRRTSNDKLFKMNKLNVILSVGNACFDQLESIIKLGKLDLPKEIVIVRSAPQIEILKRASLFLTHTGFGSMHESLYFGVPMVAIPISADQPLNARYLEKNLKGGIVANFRSLTSVELKNTIEKILSDNSYHESCLKYSKLLKNCNGAVNGSKFINSLL